MPQIDYYFSLASSWAYIGHVAFTEIARKYGVEIRYKPVPLADVFAESGGLLLPKRHPARQRYRILELQRWREKRQLNFRLHPKHWQFDATLVDCFAIAVAAKHDPNAFLRDAFAAIWEGDRNLAEPETLVQLADKIGLPGATLLATAQSDEIRAHYHQHYQDAVATGVIGSPCYVLNTEVFWGQDRLELLSDALASGRAPYHADAY